MAPALSRAESGKLSKMAGFPSPQAWRDAALSHGRGSAVIHKARSGNHFGQTIRE